MKKKNKKKSGLGNARLLRPACVRSEVLLQFADTTWAAYNCWGTTNTYGVPCDQPNIHAGSPTPPDPTRRAVKVSLNRPIATRAYRAANFPFNSELPMVRWLERNGYDVTYWTGRDADRFANDERHSLAAHKAYISVGHDEYWSGNQRDLIERARADGVNLAFFSGNEVYWKIRWEDFHQTMVVFKESQAAHRLDPGMEWTGTFRDGRAVNPEGPRPENALTGTIYTVNAWRNDPLQVPAGFAAHRFWRNTSVADLAGGPVDASRWLVQGLLGHEWDEDIDNGFRPAGLAHLSATTVDNVQYLIDEGAIYDSGTGTHHLTLHRHHEREGVASGAPPAWVFGAGTCQFSWGLDGVHDLAPGGLDLVMGNNLHILRIGEDPLRPLGDRDVQQATTNLFGEFGLLPTTPQRDLVVPDGPSSDSVPPLVGGHAKLDVDFSVRGTARDAEGTVAAVEVSEDHGSSWHPADIGASCTATPGLAATVGCERAWAYRPMASPKLFAMFATGEEEEEEGQEVEDEGTSTAVQGPGEAGRTALVVRASDDSGNMAHRSVAVSLRQAAPDGAG